MDQQRNRPSPRRAAHESCYVYVLLARDRSLCTGISPDPERRLAEHNGSRRGARALRGKRPVRLLRCWQCGSRSAALQLEAAIKKLRAVEKWSLVLSNDSELESVGGDGPHDGK